MLAVDDSLLATNMYRLLFAGHPEWDIDYVSDVTPITKFRSGGKSPAWKVIIVNTSVAARDPGSLLQIFQEKPALRKTPKIFLISPGQGALKDDLSLLPVTTLVQKPFFPYDLIMQINRILLHGNEKKKNRV